MLELRRQMRWLLLQDLSGTMLKARSDRRLGLQQMRTRRGWRTVAAMVAMLYRRRRSSRKRQTLRLGSAEVVSAHNCVLGRDRSECGLIRDPG